MERARMKIWTNWKELAMKPKQLVCSEVSLHSASGVERRHRVGWWMGGRLIETSVKDRMSPTTQHTTTQHEMETRHDNDDTMPKSAVVRMIRWQTAYSGHVFIDYDIQETTEPIYRLQPNDSAEIGTGRIKTILKTVKKPKNCKTTVLASPLVQWQREGSFQSRIC